jgi:hypothetical protein
MMLTRDSQVNLGRSLALAIDEGEFEKAASLCDEAIAIGLGSAYAAKRASIERMM